MVLWIFCKVSPTVVGKAQRFENRAWQCWDWHHKLRGDRSHHLHGKCSWLGRALRVKTSDLWLQQRERGHPCQGVEMGEMWSQRQTEVLSFVAVLHLSELI